MMPWKIKLKYKILYQWPNGWIYGCPLFLLLLVMLCPEFHPRILLTIYKCSIIFFAYRVCFLEEQSLDNTSSLPTFHHHCWSSSEIITNITIIWLPGSGAKESADSGCGLKQMGLIRVNTCTGLYFLHQHVLGEKGFTQISETTL